MTSSPFLIREESARKSAAVPEVAAFAYFMEEYFLRVSSNCVTAAPVACIRDMTAPATAFLSFSSTNGFEWGIENCILHLLHDFGKRRVIKITCHAVFSRIIKLF